jgi:excisionase family DNA binding protein
MNDGEDTAVPTNNNALTPVEAAKILGLHEGTVRRLVREGKIEAFRAGVKGGVIRIPPSALARYIEVNTTLI